MIVEAPATISTIPKTFTEMAVATIGKITAADPQTTNKTPNSNSHHHSDRRCWNSCLSCSQPHLSVSALMTLILS